MPYQEILTHPGNELGDHLRAFRAMRGLSQSEAAINAGSSHSYVSRLESGDRHPTRDWLIHFYDSNDIPDSTGIFRDMALQAAGYWPENPKHLDIENPVVGDFYAFLHDPSVSECVKDDACRVLVSLMRMARQSP